MSRLTKDLSGCFVQLVAMPNMSPTATRLLPRNDDGSHSGSGRGGRWAAARIYRDMSRGRIYVVVTSMIG